MQQQQKERERKDPQAYNLMSLQISNLFSFIHVVNG